jgi:hypothetical protein
MLGPRRSLMVGLIAGVTLLSGCASTEAESAAQPSASRAAAAESTSSGAGPTGDAPESAAEGPSTQANGDTGESTDDPVSSMPSIQPFGIINTLPVAVKIDVSDVDSYDWLGNYGRPDDRTPTGLAAIIKPGAYINAVFAPNTLANGAPFRLNVSAWVPANANANASADSDDDPETSPADVTAIQPIGSVPFNKIYMCFLQVVQLDCNLFTSKEWYGWGFRVEKPERIENQALQMCGTTRDLGTYVFNNVTRKAQIRLKCVAPEALVIGNAAVIEDVPQ